ncbi:type II secretion system F family protein [Geovibrio thiophilus]|uniref:Type II secretion system F family protein n=1 Tax=Geovibrio thiophilus TaxID=139438 RepID=A0A410JX05_9BACT|nr:type II secretion system F family protein [Geovibrio thiophilus]QAR32732.1 type II secretion system F family protein [Geovibrio thiophilus]
MIFSVRAFNSAGKKLRLTLEASGSQELSAYLAHCGLEPITVKEASNISRRFRRKDRISPAELTEILESLHLVIKSGIPLTMGLKELTEDTDSPAVESILNRVSFRTASGDSFSKACESCGSAFGETVLSLVRIGEETGRLDKTLKDASNHVQRITDLKAGIRQALMYPAFAFFSLLGALLFWIVYVMPQMAETFRVFEAELPPVTMGIIGVSGFLGSYGLFILMVSCASAVLFSYFRRSDAGFRLKTDKLILKIPVAGSLVHLFNLAFFAEYIRLMTGSGLPLYRSLSVMENSFSSTVFTRAVKGIRESVSGGESFSVSMAKQKLFPPLLVRMVSIGEQTGHLTEQLETAAEHYLDKAERTAKTVSKVLEPAVIGFVGIFMLIIFIGLLSPVFSLISGIK